MGRKLNPEASAIASGYTLDAYCKWLNADHGYSEFPHTFYGPDRAAARRQARERGWILHRDGYATCPKCNKEAMR